MIFQAAPLPPPRDMGSAKRNFPFFRENLKRHEIWVLSYGTKEQEALFLEHYGDLCKGVTFIDARRSRFINVLKRFWFFISGKSLFHFMYSDQMQEAINDISGKERFDLVHCCLALFALHSLPAGIPLVGDTHNVEYDLVARRLKESTNVFSRFYWSWSLSGAKRYELSCCRKFDVLLTTTERDRRIFLEDLPEMKITVIQNGVDQAFFLPQTVKPEPHALIFMGLMNYYPNEHAVMFFLQEVFPLIVAGVPDARLYIVGANPPRKLRELASGNIVVTGFVEDVRPHVARGSVFVIPLRIGGGIRGKALEAMAMKIPIVSTTTGCEGIDLRHEESALFADTPVDFANAVLRLLADPRLGERLATKAFQNVVEGYNWEKKGNELEAVYQSLINERNAAIRQSHESDITVQN